MAQQALHFLIPEPPLLPESCHLRGKAFLCHLSSFDLRTPGQHHPYLMARPEPCLTRSWWQAAGYLLSKLFYRSVSSARNWREGTGLKSKAKSRSILGYVLAQVTEPRPFSVLLCKMEIREYLPKKLEGLRNSTCMVSVHN